MLHIPTKINHAYAKFRQQLFLGAANGAFIGKMNMHECTLIYWQSQQMQSLLFVSESFHSWSAV